MIIIIHCLKYYSYKYEVIHDVIVPSLKSHYLQMNSLIVFPESIQLYIKNALRFIANDPDCRKGETPQNPCMLNDLR